MKIQIKKSSQRSVLTCTRDDGSIEVADLGPSFPNHDLAHFVVETQLKLTQGFYGLIEDGMSMEELNSGEVIKTLGPEIWMAEILARTLQSLCSGACTTQQFNELIKWEARVMKDVQLPEITLDRVIRMKEEMDRLCTRWSAISEGQHIELEYSSKEITI